MLIPFITWLSWFAFTELTETHHTHKIAIKIKKRFIRHLISPQYHRNAADKQQQTLHRLWQRAPDHNDYVQVVVIDVYLRENIYKSL